MPILPRILCLFLLVGLADARAQLPEPVARALKQAGIPDSHVGLVVQDIDAAVPLIAHGERRELNPASVMKLLTTLAALDTLGPVHTFSTRVLAEGDIRNGVLDGNLVLQGGGDPSLTLERFWLLLRTIRAGGLTEIHGDLIVDDGYYSLPKAETPFDAYPLRPYNAAPSALVVNFNVLSLWLDIVKGAVSARFEPAVATPTIVNRLQTAPGPCNGWQDQFTPSLEADHLILSGRFPLSCGGQGTTLSLLPAEATAYAYTKSLWQEMGGIAPATDRSGPSKADARLLLAFESAPLSQLVRDTNKYSNNLMAKMLFLNLGAARYGPPATWEKSDRAVRAWLEENHLEMPELVLDNGAGLSRSACISAASLARLLIWATVRPAYYEFAASLPAIGLEGTQKKRLEAGSPLTGRAWLKSGTLDNARSLAGYVLGPDGHRRVLVFLVNDAKAAAAVKAQDELLAWAIKTPSAPVQNPADPVFKH